jgi:hypothetical protein
MTPAVHFKVKVNSFFFFVLKYCWQCCGSKLFSMRIRILHFRSVMKAVQVTGEATQKKTSSTSKHVGQIFISNADPDPSDQIDADPDRIHNIDLIKNFFPFNTK